MRRSFKQSSEGVARNMHQFNYPHSFRGTNNAYNNRPHNNEYPHIQRDLPVGANAPLAHQNTRKFPDWYKPYTWNYEKEGYFVVLLGGFALLSWSFFNDVKEVKGRVTRKVYNSEMETRATHNKHRYAVERLSSGDPNFTKFLEKKERSHGHH
eukprot:403337949